MKVYTFSQLQAFMQCPRKYKYNYVDLVTPKFDGVPRPVGTAIHVAIDLMVRGETQVEALTAALERYWRDIQQDIFEGLGHKERDKVNKGVKQIEAVVMKYPWADAAGTKVIASEIVHQVEMGNERVYKGRTDQILEHNGGVWVHDSKTTGFGIEITAKALRLRKQFVGYYMLAEDWLLQASCKLDREVPALKGVMSDIIAKPRVYFRKDGGCTVSGEGFHREPVHVSEGDVEDFKGWFHQVANQIEQDEFDMAGVPPFSAFPMNTDSCMSFNRLCPYYECCRNPKRVEQLLGSEGFEKREELHPEYKEG